MSPNPYFLIALTLVAVYLILGLIFYMPFVVFFLSRMADPKYERIPRWQRGVVKLGLFVGLLVWPLTLRSINRE